MDSLSLILLLKGCRRKANWGRRLGIRLGLQGYALIGKNSIIIG
jgi:hypothetical protein